MKLYYCAEFSFWEKLGRTNMKTRIAVSLFIVCAFVILAGGERVKRLATSSTCQDKYQVIGGHTMCLPASGGNIPNSAEAIAIVDNHNKKRASVKPTASNMVVMQWNKALAMLAQRWAAKCALTHDEPIKRFMPGRYTVGQNIATQENVNMAWEKVIDLWYNESKSFTYNGNNNFKDVGHYTQLVWAETSSVGCAWAKCGATFFYVCNYAPAGNEARKINTPYLSGASCSGCSGHCDVNDTNALCDCKSLLCLNGATLNINTCQCTCNSQVTLYEGDYCELNCSAGTDNDRCGNSPWDKNSCRSNPTALYNCPTMCDICPYADDHNYVSGSGPLFQNSGAVPLRAPEIFVQLFILLWVRAGFFP